MAKIVTWKDEEEIAKNLLERFKTAQQSRRDFERQWELNERTILNGSGEHVDPSTALVNDPFSEESPDGSSQRIGVNKNLKNLRLIHSQMSANPPSVIPRPNTPDNEDRRKADAADRLVRHGMRKYKFPERFDQLSFHALLYGTGFIKSVWDSDGGEILDVEDNGTVTMEGDFRITVPSVWNVFPDGDVTCWEDVRYIFEGFYLPYEQALYMFPDKEDILKRHRMAQDQERGSNTDTNRNAREAKMQYRNDVVYVLQYWEKGLVVNGMQGRFCWCTTDGVPLTKLGPNPHAFKRPLSRVDNEMQKKGEDVVRPSRAFLPYDILTDIDLPNTYWGSSVLFYAANLQDKMNHLDSVTLESIEAHGVPRMVLPEGTEIADDSITNSPMDIISITGNQPPYFMENMQMPTDLMKFRDQLNNGIDDMWGVNESMFGQQSREQSGFSMQYATNQGNMIRRRLFNKYIAVVENCYKAYLNIIKENWDESRTIHVIGKEKAFEAVDVSGADIDGGFDLIVEYGASLSLDPVTRREEILTLMPVFEKAGMSPRTVLQMLKLNELDGMFDRLTLANDRQREIFEEMTASKKYIAPSKIQDHANMLAFAYDYVMTAEYKYLDKTSKSLIERHIEEREQLSQQAQQAEQPQQPAAPGGMLGGVLGALSGGGGEMPQ